MIQSDTMTDLRHAIAERGGLFTRSGLAERRKVSKSYISEVTARDDFPRPFLIDRNKPVWAGNDVDKWWDTPRKPGPKA